jgi:hypothetical protein
VIGLAGIDAHVDEAALTIPRIGVPQLSASIAGEITVPPRITFEVGSALSWSATVTRQGVDGGRTFVRAVGGAGAMATVLEAKAYQGVPVRIPLEDLVREAGETLSPTASAAVLGLFLGRWTRCRQSAAFALAGLLASAGRVSTQGAPGWRILPDGTLWVGHETWPETKLESYTVVAEAPHRGSVDILALEPAVFPGETFEGRRVSVVEHRFSSRRLVTRLFLENA